jgi:hypothetical protein
VGLHKSDERAGSPSLTRYSCLLGVVFVAVALAGLVSTTGGIRHFLLL